MDHVYSVLYLKTHCKIQSPRLSLVFFQKFHCFVFHIQVCVPFLKKSVYLFWAMLGLCCRAGFFLIVVSRGYSVVMVHGPLIAVASLMTEHKPQGWQASVVSVCGLSSFSSWDLEYRLYICVTQAQLPHGMWNLPGSGIEPVSPTLAGRFFITEPPGKPSLFTVLVSLLCYIHQCVIFFDSTVISYSICL